MKKIVRITEGDLTRIVKKVLKEEEKVKVNNIQIDESLLGRVMTYIPIGKDGLHKAVDHIENQIRGHVDNDAYEETIKTAMDKLRDGIDAGKIKTMNSILKVFKDAKAKLDAQNKENNI